MLARHSVNIMTLLTQSTTKALGNTHTQNRRMKIEAVSKMDDSFTICDYKREQPKDI